MRCSLRWRLRWGLRGRAEVGPVVEVGVEDCGGVWGGG